MHSFTTAQIAAIEALASGLTTTSAAEATGVHRTTIHRAAPIPEFRNTVEAAKMARIEAMRDKCRNSQPLRSPSWKTSSMTNRRRSRSGSAPPWRSSNSSPTRNRADTNRSTKFNGYPAPPWKSAICAR